MKKYHARSCLAEAYPQKVMLLGRACVKMGRRTKTADLRGLAEGLAHTGSH